MSVEAISVEKIKLKCKVLRALMGEKRYKQLLEKFDFNDEITMAVEATPEGRSTIIKMWKTNEDIYDISIEDTLEIDKILSE